MQSRGMMPLYLDEITCHELVDYAGPEEHMKSHQEEQSRRGEFIIASYATGAAVLMMAALLAGCCCRRRLRMHAEAAKQAPIKNATASDNVRTRSSISPGAIHACSPTGKSIDCFQSLHSPPAPGWSGMLWR
jgi:hypothetical protein